MEKKKKKLMTWTLTWLNVSAAALNATLQLLVIILTSKLHAHWVLNP